MTDQVELEFGEKEEPKTRADSSPAAGEGPAGWPERADSPAPVKRRIPLWGLLLALLLIVGGAGGYFSLSRKAASPVAPGAATAQRFPIPPKPEPQKVREIPNASPVAVEEPALSLPTGEATSAPPSAPTTRDVSSSSQKQAKTAGAEKAAAAVSPAGEEGTYTLEGGAFLLEADLVRAEQDVRRLGFDPRLMATQKMEPMTRLRVGSYPAAQARSKVKELASIAPDAFVLRQGKRVTVYAASYFNRRHARLFANRLKEKGVRVTEVAVEVPMSLTLLSFGRFNDFASAQSAADRAEAAGITVYVHKLR